MQAIHNKSPRMTTQALNTCSYPVRRMPLLYKENLYNTCDIYKEFNIRYIDHYLIVKLGSFKIVKGIKFAI